MRPDPFRNLSPEDARFLQEWNQTRTDYPRNRTVPGLFEDEARRSGTSIALLSAAAEGSLTYDALNRRANRLAWHLRGMGVGEGALVVLHLERSFDLIVAMLGVLKTGAAFSPLEPGLPLKRVAFLLGDLAPAAIVTRDGLAGSLPATWCPVVCVDSDGSSIAARSDENPLRTDDPLGLAHVLYTSGSTGEPKGVEVVHRGVVRLVKGAAYARFGPDEVFLQAAPASFDASTFEIWGALLNGGVLVLLPPRPPSLDDLGAAIRDFGVTTLWLTAGLFHLAVYERPDYLRPLRRLIAGGEVLSPARVRDALRELPGCVLVNGYGPTESTTFAACHEISSVEPDGGSIPIGRPIANTRIHLLDSDGRCVAPGEPGEIHIGGDGLARGYWRRPDLTEAAFVDSPFESAGERERLYRTGDLGRLREDGCLEFLGRSDRQLKIRGFRIEPGEIEAALERHPDVCRSAVDARASGAGVRTLAAYVVPRREGTCDEAELRRFLQGELPDHMIPAAFIRLPSLPLTANGKVDRDALPDPGQASAGPPALPFSDTESLIAEVWQAVLGIASIDRDTNFFDAGGSSLHLIEAHAKLQTRLRVTLPITALFEHPTIRAIASFLRERRDPVADLSALRDRVRGRRAAGSPATEGAS
ncbi:MAG: amino acid adenylation domain-containing protein [Acidobacteriota bacterium]